MFEIILVVILLLLTWFWLDSISKRELATQLGRDLASRFNLQLLDETVACNMIRLGRDGNGHAQLLRYYEFEVSASGVERMPCNLQILGKELRTWHIPPYIQTIQ